MKNIFYNFFNNQKNQKSNNDNIENLMYLIDRPDPTQFFLDVRQLVGCWLQKEINKLKGAHWLKTNLTYPSFEHLSIAYKNQIFCIIIDVINEKTNKHYLPEQYRQNLVKECTNSNLIPCIYKVFVNDPLNPAYNTLKPISTGWNYITLLPMKLLFLRILQQMSQLKCRNGKYMTLQYKLYEIILLKI